MSLLKRVSGKIKKEETTKTQSKLTESLGPSNIIVADISTSSDYLNFSFHLAISAAYQKNIRVVIIHVYFCKFLGSSVFFPLIDFLV